MLDCVTVTLVNRVPNSVTVSTGVSGGGTWGTISGTITDQSDLVTYVTSERPNYPVVSPNGTSFIIVAGNDGTLAAIPPTSTAPSITTLPTISGTLNVGETLTATAGTVTGEPTPTQVLQWQRSDDGLTGWSNISGATGTTYLLSYLDENKYIRVQQTEENVLGTATANSASTGQIQPATFAYLLNDYGGAAAAYSLRKLLSTYSGDAIVVRRASDNTTQAIGFVNNELDTATLESFCSGTDGFVTTWYDQSGNANNATQSIATRQPKIVSSGSTILEGGKPIIQTLPTAHFNVSATLNASNATTQFIAGKSGISGAISNTFWKSANRYVLASKQGDSSNTFSDTPDASYLNGSSFNFTNRDITFSNTTAQSLISLYWANPSFESLIKIGWTATSWAMWSTQELIIYNNDQSSNISGIESNINTHYSIY